MNMSWGKENIETPFLGVFPLGYNFYQGVRFNGYMGVI